MLIDLMDGEIEIIINCIRQVAKDFSDGEPWPEHQMIIDSLEMQRERYRSNRSVNQAMFLAVPQARKLDY